MREFTSEEIIATRFGQARKGYDPIAVDEYLEHLAEFVGWLRSEVTRHKDNEGAALELLRNAQRVADEKLLAAALCADERRGTAEVELAAARQSAARMLEAARADGDRIVSSARSTALAIEEESRTRVAELEATARERLTAIERLVTEMSQFVNDTAGDLRMGGTRLGEMADRFQFELTARSESFDVGDAPFGGTVDDAIDIR